MGMDQTTDSKMSYEVVTTCNYEQWKSHGKNCVKSFIRNWPPTIRMIFYNEDMDEDGFPIGTLVRDLPEWFIEFKAKFSGMKDAHGKDKTKNRATKAAYDFKRDCIRFSHKIAAIVDAAERSRADVLIWMDADIITDYPVSSAWLDCLFPQPAFIAWLDRIKTYPECGFFMLNLRHERTAMFIEYLKHVYVSGDVFELPQTHDSWVIEWLIKRINVEPPVSLSGEVGRKSSDPFSHSPLATKMQHLKGKKKHEKRSRDLASG